AVIGHLSRGPDISLVCGTVVRILRLPGTGRLLGTRQAPRSGHIGFSRHPDSGKIGLVIRQTGRGGRHVHLAIGLSRHSRGGNLHPLSCQMSRCQGGSQNNEPDGGERLVTSAVHGAWCSYFINSASLSFTAAPQMSYPFACG